VINVERISIRAKLEKLAVSSTKQRENRQQENTECRAKRQTKHCIDKEISVALKPLRVPTQDNKLVPIKNILVRPNVTF